MAHVGNGLVVGQRVDGGHRAFDDADAFAQHFGNRREAVGGAGSVGNDGHVGGQDAVVHAVHDGCIDIVAARCGNEDFFRAAFEVDFGFFFAGKRAGAFHDQIDTEFFPRQFGRVAGREEGDFVAVDDEVAAVVGYVGFKASVHGVEFGEVGVGFKATAGVDGDDLELVLNLIIVDGAQNLAADASVAVDGDFDAHGSFLC
ncbi:Uncharacterised protein [Neisseria meningitidis]|nr:Uncharacterised protein [Neisseria meningitidis]